MKDLRYSFVKQIYGDHNSSKNVKRVLGALLAEMPSNGLGLNIGAGRTRIDERIKNLEIEDGENIDYVGTAEEIPLEDETVDLVISQEVLEHVKDPRKAMSEIYRILKPSGRLYLQLPFVIGFHPCPNDYWRFTGEGIRQLAEDAGMVVLESGESVGSATGFYRILVEFWSVLFSALVPAFYKPLKALFALLFFPVKWLDPILRLSREGTRIAGGYYVVCARRHNGNE